MRHEKVALDQVHRQFLQLLDGTRDQAELIATMREFIQGDVPPWVDQALGRFRDAALLVA